jgi:glutamate mutase epsilon subunit
MPTISKQLFDAINDTQDGKPLRKFCRNTLEDDVLMVGDAVSALVVSAIINAEDDEGLISHLDYAASEIQKARHAVFKRINHDSIAEDAKAPRISWEEMQTLGK